MNPELGILRNARLAHKDFQRHFVFEKKKIFTNRFMSSAANGNANIEGYIL